MRSRRVVIASTVVVGALAAGLFGGAAVAGVPFSYSPEGVTAEPGINAMPMPEPTYAVNDNGLSYGSSADASSLENEPDLIEVLATNGRTGYVLKRDLDAADGTAATQTFKSPEDALEWQRSRGSAPVTIPVYESDGTTVIGEFTVTAPETEDSEH